MGVDELQPLVSRDVLVVSAVPFALPMRRRFRGVDVREGMVLQGPSGWGEWAPFAEYSDQVAARGLASAIESAFGTWPLPRRDVIPVNAIIPGTTAVDAYALTRVAVTDQGCTTMKVKVGEPGRGLLTVPDDVERVAAVRAALDDCGVGEASAIRVDANTVWSVDEAEAALVLLNEAARGLDYAEQPCATLAELAELRQRIDIPIAADESIRTADDPRRAAESGAVDVLVVKAPPLGGVHAALRVVVDTGVRCIVSGAMDSAVGLSAGIALAAALPDLGGACGLGTGSLLATDLVSTPLVPNAGVLPVARVSPEPEALERAAARMSVERQQWWWARMHRAYGVLATQFAAH